LSLGMMALLDVPWFADGLRVANHLANHLELSKLKQRRGT
jgi:hypothetical protein